MIDTNFAQHGAEQSSFIFAVSILMSKTSQAGCG